MVRKPFFASRLSTAIGCGVLALQLLSSVTAQASTDIDPDDLLDLPLEQLADIVVTSVSKKEEPLNKAAAAIFVLTQQDIRRSGATTIPEALRLVPGVSVARSGSNRWAISARGVNDQFANKLLVLMDGRTLYSPLFSGVYWDKQDTMMEDIDRIEVIRGPGATLWGANAVNGVINIITKDASKTQGGLAVAGAGNQEVGFGRMRYGTQLSENAHLRVYAKHREHGNSRSLNPGVDLDDDGRMQQGGFRLDWQATEHDHVTIQGDAYQGSMDNTITMLQTTAPYEVPVDDVENFAGGNLLGRWEWESNPNRSQKLQFFVDHIQRRVRIFDRTRTTLDMEFQQSWNPEGRHDVVWGAGARYNMDEIKGSYFLYADPDERELWILNTFIQDEITLLPDELFLTVGSKFEWNEHTGFEYQPSTRLLWQAAENHTFWGAISRAIRSPNRGTDDIRFITRYVPNTPVIFAQLNGSREVESEVLHAYELGYRWKATSKLSFDIAGFYNEYDKITANQLTSLSLVTTGPFAPHLLAINTANNDIKAQNFGAELTAEWQPYDNWKLVGTYSYLETDLETTSSSLITADGSAPYHQATIRSHWNPIENVEIDNIFYYVGDIRSTGVSTIGVNSYTRFDTRIAWRPWENVELSLVGQNLFDDWHQEFSNFEYNVESEIGRSVYGQIKVEF